ncbi:MAG: manganese oxidase, partial [Acidobacteriota bacterium]|nr:manganese oxidase [Acidobacteriota bacterium]
YKLDDYQVRTPTDIIGQHIHLVKFDVTSSDGAANGFNYEDGTLSNQEVTELIHGINECGGLANDPAAIGPCQATPPDKCKPGSGRACLEPQPVPKQICDAPTDCSKFLGAQTTVQRWYSDHISSASDVVNGERTLRTVFTHDHFGPSTHQQTGLYAAFLVEPTDSKWYLNQLDTNGALVQMGTRYDGGPTSWAAVIETPSSRPERGGSLNTYREFALALQDFQYAYTGNSPSAPATFTGTEFFGGTTPPVTVTVPESWASPTTAIQPPPAPPPTVPPGPTAPLPQLVGTGPTPGTMSFNYRNEPLAYRVAPPASGTTGTPEATDLSYVFSSQVTRNVTSLNSQPAPGSTVGTSGFKFPGTELTPGMMGPDPFTPLLRAYEGDRVQMRVIVGAHMLPHDFTVQGIKWLFEPSFANSGYRSNQSMGISEHFEFIFDTPRASPAANTAYNWSDYLYMPDASNQAHGLVDGTWGLFRAYKTPQNGLPLLSTNKYVAPLPPPTLASGYSCPPNAPIRAMTINALAPDQMTINSRGVDGFTKFPGSKIFNQYPLMYSFLSMTPPGGSATAMVPSTSEPLILRANAGECIALTLQNAMNPAQKVFTLTSTVKTPQAPSAAPLTLSSSYQAGITPALLSYDVMRSGGTNVGWNPPQTVPYQKQATYYWYAGQTQVEASGRITGWPLELGPVNLTPSDPLEQDLHGLVGGLIVEPANSVACFDDINPTLNGGKGVPTYASAYIYTAGVYSNGDCSSPGALHHREFVMLTQDDMVNLYWPASCYCAVPKSGADRTVCTQAQCSTTIEKAIANPLLIQTTVNYRTEPMPYRFNATSFVNLTTVYRGFSDGLVLGEPQTPIFAAARNTPTRFHLLHPGGSGNQQVLALHGHVWQELPFIEGSSRIGDNRLSQWLGARDNYGTNTSYSIILEDNGGAGGQNGVKGDYIYRTTPANFVTQGLWGIFRVGDAGRDTVSIAAAQFSSAGLLVSGSSTAFLDNQSNPKNGQRAQSVSLYRRTKGSTGNGTLISNKVTVGYGGLWSYNEKIVLSDASNQEIVA